MFKYFDECFVRSCGKIALNGETVSQVNGDQPLTSISPSFTPDGYDARYFYLIIIFNFILLFRLASVKFVNATLSKWPHKCDIGCSGVQIVVPEKQVSISVEDRYYIGCLADGDNRNFYVSCLF